MYSAYLDRFTDNNKALILVEELQKEFHVDISSLLQVAQPEHGF